jgi:uncharacterized membrane protein
MKKHPEIIRQEEINEKDERSVQIRGRAAQSTFYISLFGMVAVNIIFLFMDLLIPCVIIIGLMALHAISYFAFIGHFNKEM